MVGVRVISICEKKIGWCLCEKEKSEIKGSGLFSGLWRCLLHQTSLVYSYDIRHLQNRICLSSYASRRALTGFSFQVTAAYLKHKQAWIFFPLSIGDLLTFPRHRMSLSAKYGSLFLFYWNKRHLDKWIIWFQCLFWTNPEYPLLKLHSAVCNFVTVKLSFKRAGTYIPLWAPGGIVPPFSLGALHNHSQMLLSQTPRSTAKELCLSKTNALKSSESWTSSAQEGCPT